MRSTGSPNSTALRSSDALTDQRRRRRDAARPSAARDEERRGRRADGDDGRGDPDLAHRAHRVSLLASAQLDERAIDILRVARADQRAGRVRAR